MYLGARIKKKQLSSNTKPIWTMSSEHYVVNAIKVVEEGIRKRASQKEVMPYVHIYASLT